MFLLNTKITTKNLISLKKILNFILKFGIQNKKILLNLSMLKTLNFRCDQHNKVITLLTSPQANKNAQEQFLIRTYSKNLIIFSFNNVLKTIILLKKIKMYIFSEVKIQLNFLQSKKKIKYIVKKIFNPESTKTTRL